MPFFYIQRHLHFFFFTLLFFSPFPSSALNSQGQTLISWKQTWNSNTTGSVDPLPDWDPSDPNPCRWHGITCNSKYEVVEVTLQHIDLYGHLPTNFTLLEPSLAKLVLSGTNLTGPIPRQISSLLELTALVLSDNALTGEIPGSICGLPKLESLLLNANGLEGPIPDEVGNLTSLVELALYDNKLSGSIPSSVGRLGRLEVVRAGGNKNLGGSIPKELGNCSSLILIGLAETSVSGFLPSSLGMLKNLQTLAIYTTLLSGQIPPELGGCGSLRNVYLYENSLTGSIPSSLGNLKRLQNLLLWQNSLFGAVPSELGNCSELVIIDASMNSLTGTVPESFGNLRSLQELQLSSNQISGSIPAQLGNCTALTLIELDNNRLTGNIPQEVGNLSKLTLLFLWQNQLEGDIPQSLSYCRELEAIDLSQNELTGSIPSGVFGLQKLNKLLLLSNNLSGVIPPEIGRCSSLARFRASNNKLTGNVPPEIGRLRGLVFLDLGFNRLSGTVPVELARCSNLTFLDLHSNSLTGNLPVDLDRLVNLQFLDVSDNMIQGTLSPGLGSLTSLTKLDLSKNRLTGSIPGELGSCSRLQMLDLSSNGLEGPIPGSLGNISGLEIALNLSRNGLSGPIPEEFSGLDRLGVLDLSYNNLSGDLRPLQDLQNLVSLNVSHNGFSGRVPDTPFFAGLPLSVLSGNPELCLSSNNKECSVNTVNEPETRSRGAKVAMVVLLCTACLLLLTALYIVLRAKKTDKGFRDDDGRGPGGSPWEVTVYQKLDLSIEEVVRSLTDSNLIGQGHSGAVYRATIGSGRTVAVKRFRENHSSPSTFSSEIATLARVRHRNVVRLLGWASNGKAQLLFFDYWPNGTLGELLHDGREVRADWHVRFKVALGVAEGLAYLHHHCVPPILHRDVKAHNVLLGDRYEPCLADFGLARFVEGEGVGSFSAHPQFAGSYGYFAPEYSSMLKITEKSDVYSYGVVLLEIITGKKPVDPSFPDEAQHVIQWARDHLNNQHDPIDIIDPKLIRGHHTDTIKAQEILQALGIALLCTSNRPEDRPAMKDVVALLKEIGHERQATSGELKKPVNSYTSPADDDRFLIVQRSSNCSVVDRSASSCSTS